MTAEITKALVGLPGTGKTTALLDILAEEINSGTPVGSIAASTFRKRMAREFEARAQGVVDGGLPDENWFGTTHSLCYGMLGHPDVIQDEHRVEFCNELGIQCSASSLSAAEKADLESTSFDGENIGDLAFNARSWCLQTNRDPAKGWRSSSLSLDERSAVRQRSPTNFEEFNERYEQFKTDRGLIDFDDMLLIVREQELVPPVEVLIEDEFQDKSPLQMDIFRQWSQDIDRVYVAGDPYQAIYGFAGTDPKYMEAAVEEADVDEVLDTSYRFGPELWDFAMSVLTRVRYDVPEITPIGESTVQKIGFNEYQTLVNVHAEDDCLHLFRCNYMADKASEALKNAGVPFSSPRGVRWTDRMVYLYNGIAKLCHTASASRNTEKFGGVLSAQYDLNHITAREALEVAKALAATHHSGMKKTHVETLEEVLDPDSDKERSDVNLLRMFTLGSIAGAIADAGNPVGTSAFISSGFGSSAAQERMETAYDQLNGETIDGIDHRVMTIHAAKGAEAENVFLFDGLSRSIMDENGPFPETEPSEARVFFVGATRAEKNLYVVEYPHEPRIDLPKV